jgi:hypothetical protein
MVGTPNATGHPIIPGRSRVLPSIAESGSADFLARPPRRFVIFVPSFRVFRLFVRSWFQPALRPFVRSRFKPSPIAPLDLRRRTYCNSVKIVYNFTIEGCEFMYKVDGA